MSENGLDLDELTTESKHNVAAVTACVVSVLLHIVLLIMMADFKFDLHILDMGQVKEEYKPEESLVIDVKQSEEKVKAIAKLLRGETVDFSSAEKTGRKPGTDVDTASLEPPSVPENDLTDIRDSIAKPAELPERQEWTPRREILQIEERIADDSRAMMPRRLVTTIERVADAPDFPAAVDLSKIKKGASKVSTGIDGSGKPGLAKIDSRPASDHVAKGVKPVKADAPVKKGTTLFEEKPAEITGVKPIEKHLVPRVTVYSSMRDFKYQYFKIEVKRAGADILPVLSKDVIFIQDNSASVTEQRLYFCRNALKKCLDMLGPDDRFNVVSFSDKESFCFPGWMPNKKPNIDKAKAFISALKSGGNTDIYASMKNILSVKSEKARPVVALLVSDGMANTGVTRSSNIIGEFSKMNDGRISVFTMGTTKEANAYLLDFLGYANKGGVFKFSGGRWGIPESLEAGMKSVSRPVMSGVKFRFPAGSDVEVYPLLASNIYLDRSMVIYGRCSKKTGSIVFQAAGDSGSTRCDMLFDLSLQKKVGRGDKDIRKSWAKQKLYHLIGQYARTPNPGTLSEIKSTAKKYGVKIPHKGKF